MRAWEFLTESDKPANPKAFGDGQMDAIKGAISMPDLSINKSNGSPYLAWRFGIAMAGAPDYPTPPVGPMAGDPLLSTYTDAELEIINAAAKSVGAGQVKKLSDNRSTELSNTNVTSPVAKRAPDLRKKK
jgi:hypothetical protein